MQIQNLHKHLSLSRCQSNAVSGRESLAGRIDSGYRQVSTSLGEDAGNYSGDQTVELVEASVTFWVGEYI